MTDDPHRRPRSPLKVALLTFGAVVLIGSIISFALLDLNGNLHDEPFARGEAVGRAVGMAGVGCALIAYFIQKQRLARK